MTAIRLGLIGTGLATERLHWPALAKLTDRYDVTAYADTSLEQAKHFASYSGLDLSRHAGDYRDLLARDDVDAVLVSVPISLLYSVARDAVAAGKHVLCEKPTGVDESEAQAFLELADSHPELTILVGENYFYRDDLRLARSLLDAGAIGDLHLMTWRFAAQLVPREGSFTVTPWRQRPAYRGGIHLDNGVHHLAQIRMLCGEISSVYAATQGWNASMGAPSDLASNLSFETGAIGSYTACFPDIPLRDETHEMRLYGSSGQLLVGRAADGMAVKVYRPDGSGDAYAFTGSDFGYHGELLNFSDAIRHGEPVVGTVRQSYVNMLTVLRALDSASSGSVVSVADLASPVPLWRPRGASGLVDGLPASYTVTPVAA